MAINFPNSPSAGDPHSEAGIDWVYDGEKWVAQSEATFWARTNSTLSPSTAGDNISTTGTVTASSLILPTAPAVGYQQGDWTPVFVSTTVSGGNVAGTPYTGTSWSRIGSLVTLNYTFNVGGNTPGNVNVNDTWVFSGVPYNVQNFGQTLSQGWTTGDWDSGNRWFIQAFMFDNNGTDNIKWGGSFAGNSATVRAGKSWRCMLQYTTDDTTWTPINGATIS